MRNDDRSAMVTALCIAIIILSAMVASLYIDRNRESEKYERLVTYSLRLAYQELDNSTSKLVIQQIDKDSEE